MSDSAKAAALTELPDASRVPFVISVTGHRDPRPDSIPQLRKEVTHVLQSMQKRMPSTPIVVLSGLAEGADQLVSEIALRHGIALAVALPMPLDVYRTTMSPEAAARLDGLLPQCSIRIDLPVGATAEALRSDETLRAECYETLALFLARQGQALIALWDGDRAEKMGGTSRVVRYVRTGGDSLDAAPDARCGVVYHVVTPRESHGAVFPAVNSVVLTCDVASKGRSIPRAEEDSLHETSGIVSFKLVEENIERFNKESARRTHAASPLVSHGVELTPAEQRLQTLFSVADSVSLRANGQRKLALFLILFTAIAGTIFYGVHGEMLEPHVGLWLTFPAFVTAALLLHRGARILHVEDRYLDARALAEALRVQFFWNLAGIEESVDRYYLAERQSELDWLRLALRGVWLVNQGARAARQPNQRVVLDQWIHGQRAWFKRKASRQAYLVKQRQRISHNALIAAVVWSILVPVSILVHGPWSQLGLWRNLEPGDWRYQTLHVALAIPALLAAAYKLWIEQAGYEEQAKEYRLLAVEFSSGAAEIEAKLHAGKDAREGVQRLGIAALQENARWLSLHRERPLEVLSSP